MADQGVKNKSPQIPNKMNANTKRKRMVLILLGVALLLAVIGGGYVLFKPSDETAPDAVPQTVIFEGQELIVPDYLANAEFTPISEPNYAEVIQELETQLTTDGVTEDNFGTNTYMALAQLYYSEGNKAKAIEYYELAWQYISQKEDSADKRAQLESIDTIITTVRNEEQAN